MSINLKQKQNDTNTDSNQIYYFYKHNAYEIDLLTLKQQIFKPKLAIQFTNKFKTCRLPNNEVFVILHLNKNL